MFDEERAVALITLLWSGSAFLLVGVAVFHVIIGQTLLWRLGFINRSCPQELPELLVVTGACAQWSSAAPMLAEPGSTTCDGIA